MPNFKKLDFKPPFWMRLNHLQMILSAYSPVGKEPHSERRLVDIGNGDQLSCEISTPENWSKNGLTVILLHGLSGSHNSRYMVRMARKLTQRGHRVVRNNLRNCGSGVGLSKLPYGDGNSRDILKVIQSLKAETPDTKIILMGFSLGGNTALKLGGELGDEGEKYLKTIIAVCPPLDLESTVLAIQRYPIYHRYYLNTLLKQAGPWINQKISSIYEYDDKINGPLWGFKGAKDYYEKGSSKNYISKIKCETHILLAEDDPFISIELLNKIPLPEQVHVWTTKHGGHLGFLGRIPNSTDYQWLDNLLLNWVEGMF